MTFAQLFSIASSIFVLATIFQLVKNRKLREQYSLLWFVAGFTLLIVSLRQDFIDLVADWLGIDYSPAVIILIAIFFGIILFIHFSMIVSQLMEDRKDLAQEIALLKQEIQKYQKPV